MYYYNTSKWKRRKAGLYSMAKRFNSWKTLDSEEVFETPWMSIYHNHFELPNGKKGNYFYLHTRGSTMIIPIMDDGKILLVHQYRYLMDKDSIEIPCGGIKNDQDETDAAHAELIEETGYDCKRLKRIGKFIPYNGLSDEFCTVFVARVLFSVDSKPDETEQIEAEAYTPDEIDTMIENGKIVDGMSIAGWALAKKYIDRYC
jgi:ADP-ribose pyrophosphatase